MRKMKKHILDRMTNHKSGKKNRGLSRMPSQYWYIGEFYFHVGNVALYLNM